MAMCPKTYSNLVDGQYRSGVSTNAGHCWYYANMIMHYRCRLCGYMTHFEPEDWSAEHDRLGHIGQCEHEEFFTK